MPEPHAARRSLARRVALLVAALALTACEAPPQEQLVLRKALGGLVAKAPEPAERGGSGRGKRRAMEAATYVDGVPRGMLRFAELPEGLPVRWKTLDDGRKVRRYRLAEYLEALGTDLASVREIHLYGGRERVSVLAGDELRRHREDMLFSFTQGEGGKPRLHYPKTASIQVNTFIDAVENIAVYAGKPPPDYDTQKHRLSLNGAPVDGIPYASGERPGGTRVYVDGALRAWVKRKVLTSGMAEGGAGDSTRYSLARYLASVGVTLASAQALEVVSGDEIVARFEGAGLSDKALALTFTLPPKSHGEIELPLESGARKISAVRVRVSDPEPGSSMVHPSPPAPAKSGLPRVARALQSGPGG